jgi:uncharacterized membrane protein YtjA (UPF0391 family)
MRANFAGLGIGTIISGSDWFDRGTAHRCRDRPTSRTEELNMFGWVITFLIVALIAGILGFGGIAGASIEIAKIIFFIALVLFLVSAVVGVSRGRTRV